MDNAFKADIFERPAEPNEKVVGTFETCPLNPATNKNYVDEIEKSIRLREAYEKIDPLFKRIKKQERDPISSK